MPKLRALIPLTLLALFPLSCSRGQAGTEASATTASSASLHEAPSFKVTLEAVGPYEKDKEGVAVVRLTAKGDYKVNDEYPFRFACQDPPADGVSYPKPTLGRGDGKFGQKEAEIAIPFVPRKSGKLQVGGVLSLSVCTEANCIMDKRPLVVEVTVP